MPSRSTTEELYKIVAQDAQYECGYCRVPQRALPYRLEIEHLLPASLGGVDKRDNLWLSCHKCNKMRSNLTVATDPLTQNTVALFNPRRNDWNEHFV